jgi:Na+-transporting methylmalonyl-CoA/oxaloacetate decarboxylase gamma subunit
MNNYLMYGLTFLGGLVIGSVWMLVYVVRNLGRAASNFFNPKEKK